MKKYDYYCTYSIFKRELFLPLPQFVFGCHETFQLLSPVFAQAPWQQLPPIVLFFVLNRQVQIQGLKKRVSVVFLQAQVSSFEVGKDTSQVVPVAAHVASIL